MKIDTIEPTPRFAKNWKRLPETIQKKTVKTIKILRNDPFHPSLRLHKLSGNFKDYWSISVDLKYRIIFRMDNGTAILFGIGTHAIYENR